MKYVHKHCPCPVYDVEKIESWLTDMAKEGLVLAEDGFTGNFAKFEKTEPVCLKYRLEAAEKRPGLLSEAANPDDEQR